jgi:hypothetical protein
MLSNKIENNNYILPINYSIEEDELNTCSNDSSDSVSKIIQVVETHVVSTIKSIFSTIYSYAKNNRGSFDQDNRIFPLSELKEIYIVHNDQDLVANMV